MGPEIVPERVTYTETYRTECPHGCEGGARVIIMREKRGPVTSIRVTCAWATRTEAPQPAAPRR